MVHKVDCGNVCIVSHRKQMPIDSKQGDDAQKLIECAAGTGQFCITTGNHTRRDRRKDGRIICLWLAPFLDGITGENGNFRDGRRIVLEKSGRELFSNRE